MDINGLVEFLALFQDGGDLEKFEVLGVEQYDHANMRYGVTLGYGPLRFVANSYMPAGAFREWVARLAREVTAV